MLLFSEVIRGGSDCPFEGFGPDPFRLFAGGMLFVPVGGGILEALFCDGSLFVPFLLSSKLFSEGFKLSGTETVG